MSRFGIRELIDEQRGEMDSVSTELATKIIESDSFRYNLKERVNDSRTSGEFRIDDIHGIPSDMSKRQWNEIITVLERFLLDEGVKVTNHGYEYCAVAVNDTYLIYLEW